MFRTKIFFSTLVIILCLNSCVNSGGGDDENDSQSSDLSSETDSVALNSNIISFETETDSSGIAYNNFTVPDGVNKLSITAESPGFALRYLQIQGDSGHNYLHPNGQTVSLSGDFSAHVQSASVPSRRQDPQLISGETISTLAAISGGGSGHKVLFTVNTQSDSSLESGILNVNVFRVGPLAQNDEAKNAISEAIYVMRDILVSNAKTDINLRLQDIDGPNILPSPFNGSDLYLNASNSGLTPAVNIFIGADIEDGNEGILGVASMIPGSPNPTLLNSVAISITTGAGPDGFFSSEDKRLLGETLAHESGHYLGLFHPIEASDGPISISDPLPDTNSCATFQECLNNESLVRNLMFPTPVSFTDGSLIPQNVLTQDQSAVINRHLAVN